MPHMIQGYDLKLDIEHAKHGETKQHLDLMIIFRGSITYYKYSKKLYFFIKIQKINKIN